MTAGSDTMNTARRRWLVGWTAAAVWVAGAGWAAAADGPYQTLNPAHATDVGAGKIEVIEFFSFACPHCNHLEPALEAWSRKLPPNVVLRRIPVLFGRPEWESLARLSYTLEAMKLGDRLHGKVFQAIHEQHQNLGSQQAAATWAGTQGLDVAQFSSLYNSFTVSARLSQGDAKAREYAVDGVPSLIVDGRFRTSPAQAGGNDQVIAVLNDLIAHQSGGHKP